MNTTYEDTVKTLRAEGFTDAAIVSAEAAADMPDGEAETPKVSLDLLSTRTIRPAPENDKVYAPVDPADPAFIAFVEDVERHGILNPLLVSSDGYIISGHRRYAAAKACGLQVIPCRISEVSRADDPDDFMELLVANNNQRCKTFGEKMREELVKVNPEDSYAALSEYRKNKSQISLTAMDLLPPKKRKAISRAKLPLLSAVQKVIQDNIKYGKLSVRQIHYQLLNVPGLLIHASKPDSLYQNNLKSYNATVDIVSRGRLTGTIPWKAICDETRPFVDWDVHDDCQTFIHAQFDGFLKGYSRNLLTSQPNWIEVVCEKNTVLGILKSVCSEFTVPITSGRGFCSLIPRQEMVQRFKNSGKEKLVVLVCSDLDPEGWMICESMARQMRDDFGLTKDQIHFTKVAITPEIVKRFHLPSDLEAKLSSTNYKKYVSLHGTHAYELESLEPSALQGLLRDALDAVIDVEAFNAEIEAEKQDAAKLEGMRRAMKATMGNALGADNE